MAHLHWHRGACQDYDWINPATVLSDCDGWRSFPFHDGRKQRVNAATWGSSQEGYLTWWLSHLPANPGSNTAYGNRMLNNWWTYVAFYQLPAITVEQPGPGDDWRKGSTHTIRWISQSVAGEVEVELFRDGQGLGSLATVPASACIFDWAIPFDPGLPAAGDYRVHVAAADGSAPRSASPSSFPIPRALSR